MRYVFLLFFLIDSSICYSQILPAQHGVHNKKSANSYSNQQNFSYTGAEQSFTIPGGVNSILIKVWGAEGDNDQAGFDGGGLGGGLGGYAEGYLSVTPGQVIKIYVGESPSCNSVCSNGSPGGYNGGGIGNQYGAPGGGATDVRIGSYSLNDRVIVAGGGGGNAMGSIGGYGGAGGGLIGGDGEDNGVYLGGHGGTQDAGGIKAGSYGSGQGGSFGQGGGMNNAYHNAGGGGGWYGGGMGSGHGGGGGGSSYIGGVTSGSTTSGIRSSHGKAEIYY